MASSVLIPPSLRGRVADVARAHGLGSTRDAALHFIARGLDRYGAPPGDLTARLSHVVEEQGYSSEDELVEHLLLRGLRAYEEPAASTEALAARLRGLGYID
jgi:hypothetical protein